MQEKIIRLLPIFLCIIVFAVFLQGLTFGFTNWDDPQYILKNDWIRHWDKQFLIQAFTQSHFGHYHPFTWLSLSLDYQLFQLWPAGYHLHNLLLHLINVLLVLYLIKRMTKHTVLSFLVALAFAVHPAANESVMWITERKNLLFTTYYLLSLLTYLYYIESRRITYYLLSFLFFIASLLSKGSAITLPAVLLLLLYGYRRIQTKEVIRLLPFAIIALIFALIAQKAQSPFLKDDVLSLSLTESLLYSSWAFWWYLIKAFIPLNLSAFHPMFIHGSKFYYVIGLFALLFLLGYAYHKHRKENRWFVVGVLFFLANIIMYLKIFNAYASSYFMADRYTYLAYVGLFLAVFLLFFEYRKRFRWLNYLLLIWLAALIVVSVSYARTWQNSYSLWKNVLSYYPTSHVALLNFGNACRESRKYDEAIKAYSIIDRNSSLYYQMLENRAFVFYSQKNYNNALIDYQQLLMADSSRSDIRQYIVTILLETGNTQLARSNLQSILSFNPNMSEAWNSLGNYFVANGQADSAIWAYSRAIKLKPAPMYFYNRANVYSQNNFLDLALLDYQKAIEADSNRAEYFMNRGITYYKRKNYKAALTDFSKAIQLQPDNVDVYINRSTLFFEMKQFANALDDLNMAVTYQPANAELLIRRSYLYSLLGQKDLACQDAKQAIQLGSTQYYQWMQKVCQ